MTNFYTLPDLPYNYDALEPFIDEITMKLHHDKHHATYVEKLNEALNKVPDFTEQPIEKVLNKLDLIPEYLRTAIHNHGGGHTNHAFFWQILASAGSTKIYDGLAHALDSEFGSFDNFKKQFTTAALNQFGSGWAWLVLDKDKKLSIISTSNQDSPLSQGLTPILNLDVWEHAYYLKYQNRRAEYIENWWHIVNWDQVNKLYNL